MEFKIFVFHRFNVLTLSFNYHLNFEYGKLTTSNSHASIAKTPPLSWHSSHMPPLFCVHLFFSMSKFFLLSSIVATIFNNVVRLPSFGDTPKAPQAKHLYGQLHEGNLSMSETSLWVFFFCTIHKHFLSTSFFFFCIIHKHCKD